MARKIINSPDTVVPEMMEGYISAFNRYFEKVPNVNGVLHKGRRKDKVTLVIGGGSGHEPVFSCFVGKGLADAAACGNIFASPDPGTICETAKAAHAGKGILFLYGNYSGDNMNFDMAEEILNGEGIKTRHVRVWDDCASAPPDRMEDRRGIAGDVFMIKIAGAACDAGLSLDEAAAVAEKARANLRSIGFATAPGQIPGNEKPAFELGENEIEYGIGLHGEPGIERAAMKTADEMVQVLYGNIIKDMPLARGGEVCVLVNGMGSTTIMELSIVFRKVKQLLEADGITIYDADINSYCTCMEMAGCSITVLKLDGELKKFYDAPCFSPYYSREGR